ncbi:MAG TPA: SRPBCC domain-containing protein [Acidimicrobiia bacterium]|nr:SRPBCC domain-containing protein [Acidimicrobiia bacterium]
MTAYTVSRTIDASPDVIWELLTDADSYPEWNPAVLGIEGDIREGRRIGLTSIVDPERQFKLNVSDVEPPRRMVWSDGMPLGLFKGVRTFEVAPKDDGSSRFTMTEVYSGLMAPLITKSIPNMTDSFEKFADGLKAAAETR